MLKSLLSLLGKTKPPEKILLEAQQYIIPRTDYQRELYLEQNIQKIKQALANHTGTIDDGLDIADELHENNTPEHFYLCWHSLFMEELTEDDENDDVDRSQRYHAAEYFFEQTSVDVMVAFQKMFTYAPVQALRYLAPMIIIEFEKDILKAMETLTDNENPYLYFDCFDEMLSLEYYEGRVELPNRLTVTTSLALDNMLNRDPDVALFKFAQKNLKLSYWDYLPHGTYREALIAAHIDKIDAVLREIAPNANDRQYQGFKDLFNSFEQDKDRPVQLMKLRNLMAAERIKLCFRMAADPALGNFSKAILSLDGEPTDYIKTHMEFEETEITADGILLAQTSQPFIPRYELVRFENPSAWAEEDDKDMGADSKYLWMIRKSDQALVSAFTKAGVTEFLEAQTGYVVGEMPTVKEWKESFFPQFSSPERLAIEI